METTEIMVNEEKVETAKVNPVVRKAGEAFAVGAATAAGTVLVGVAFGLISKAWENHKQKKAITIETKDVDE